MSPLVLVPAISVGLFFGMLACLEIGYRIGGRAEREPRAHEGLGAMDGAIFGLFGLLLGFAFAGATSRLDARRQLIVQEANAIETAYLRLDVLPSSTQPELRHLFRDYLESRFRAYDAGADMETVERFITQAMQLQQKIWTGAVAAGQLDQTQNTARLVLPAINEMIDITTSRRAAARTRLPGLVLGLLLLMALINALIAGYARGNQKRRSVLHAVLYATAVATTVYVVLDLDNPRFGLIRLDATDQLLHELHDSIRQ